jgi:predicted permease
MIFHAVTPLILIIFLGLILEKINLLRNTFVDAAIEIIYRTTLPILVLWGIIRNADSLLFIWSYWGFLLLAPLILLGTVYLFQFLRKKLYFLQKIKLGVLVKIVMPLGLSLINFMFDPTVMGNICVLTFVIIPFLDLALKYRFLAFSVRGVFVSAEVKLWVRDIVFHPIVIAGLLGLFFLDDNNLLIFVLIKTTGVLVPAILPLCLLITGAKLGQCSLLEKFKNQLIK